LYGRQPNTETKTKSKWAGNKNTKKNKQQRGKRQKKDKRRKRGKKGKKEKGDVFLFPPPVVPVFRVIRPQPPPSLRAAAVTEGSAGMRAGRIAVDPGAAIPAPRATGSCYEPVLLCASVFSALFIPRGRWRILPVLHFVLLPAALPFRDRGWRVVPVLIVFLQVPLPLLTPRGRRYPEHRPGWCRPPVCLRGRLPPIS